MISAVHMGVGSCVKGPCTGWSGQTAHLLPFLQTNCRNWLANDFGVETNEPSYLKIERKCIFETILPLGVGGIIPHVSVFFLHGKPMMLSIQQNLITRYGGTETRTGSVLPPSLAFTRSLLRHLNLAARLDSCRTAHSYTAFRMAMFHDPMIQGIILLRGAFFGARFSARVVRGW